jgi:hypothetical protein
MMNAAAWRMYLGGVSLLVALAMRNAASVFSPAHPFV